MTGEGHFAFRDAPERRIRFFGPNLVGNSSYLDRKTADDFVTKMTRLGYNTVRFHHFENDLLDRNAKDSLTFNPKTLDQFDYLFAELKKRGIYLCLDLYASRALRPGDNIREREGRSFGRYDFEIKTLVTLSPSAMANWKEFARRLLTHRNPYTGLTYAEDPALYSLNLVNENPLVSIWNRIPQLVPLFEERYVEFLKERKLDTPENRASRGGLFIEFLNDLQIRCIEEQKRFLKEELQPESEPDGVRAADRRLCGTAGLGRTLPFRLVAQPGEHGEIQRADGVRYRQRSAGAVCGTDHPAALHAR